MAQSPFSLHTQVWQERTGPWNKLLMIWKGYGKLPDKQSQHFGIQTLSRLQTWVHGLPSLGPTENKFHIEAKAIVDYLLGQHQVPAVACFRGMPTVAKPRPEKDGSADDTRLRLKD